MRKKVDLKKLRPAGLSSTYVLRRNFVDEMLKYLTHEELIELYKEILLEHLDQLDDETLFEDMKLLGYAHLLDEEDGGIIEC